LVEERTDLGQGLPSYTGNWLGISALKSTTIR